MWSRLEGASVRPCKAPVRPGSRSLTHGFHCLHIGFDLSASFAPVASPDVETKPSMSGVASLAARRGRGLVRWRVPEQVLHSAGQVGSPAPPLTGRQHSRRRRSPYPSCWHISCGLMSAPWPSLFCAVLLPVSPYLHRGTQALVASPGCQQALWRVFGGSHGSCGSIVIKVLYSRPECL